MAKRYYWLKLKEDYFRTKEIKKLRKIAGGDTFTIIYLKMQLLSLKNEGILIYEGVEDNLSKELALELDEEEENVKLTLAFLQTNNMIEQKNDCEFFLNRVPETIKSETDAAERMRISRQKKKEICNNVTPLLQNVSSRYTDIDIDIDIEKDKDRDIDNKNIKNKPAKVKETKHKYGEYKNVLLSDAELEKLKTEFPLDWRKRIETVSEYCASKGKNYSNYLATIRNWAKNEKKGGDKNGNYGSVKINVPKNKFNPGTRNLDEEIKELGLI